MKRYYIAASLWMLTAAAAWSQPTAYDVEKLSHNELNGTARFVGMGGAMGALGSDISTIATNPAGLALFRRADVMLTVGFDQNKTEAGGLKETSDKMRLNNVGVVIPFSMSGSSSLVNMNFGFNYQRRNTFYKNLSVSQALASGVSQINQMADMAGGTSEYDIAGTEDYNPFYNEQVGWLPILGYNIGVIGADEEGGSTYSPTTFPNGSDSYFSAQERGGVDQLDVSFSFNFNDRVYVGASLGYYEVDYTKNTYYRESVMDATFGKLGYDVYSDNWIHGDGVDFKLGVIARPFEESSLRFGFAVHTPVFYRLTLTTGFDAASAYTDEGPDGMIDVFPGNVNSYDNIGGSYDQDFKLRTPWLFNLSAGYTIGSDVALGVEYEYEDFSSSNLKDAYSTNYRFGNDEISSQLKGVHTLRLGTEIKLMPELALRLGYNYSSSAYDKGSYKVHPYNSINTDTEFTNRHAMNTVTGGLGIRLSRNTYLDMAYKYQVQKGDFYAFDHLDLKSVELTDSRHSFLATIGYRF